MLGDFPDEDCCRGILPGEDYNGGRVLKTENKGHNLLSHPTESQ